MFRPARLTRTGRSAFYSHSLRTWICHLNASWSKRKFAVAQHLNAGHLSATETIETGTGRPKACNCIVVILSWYFERYNGLPDISGPNSGQIFTRPSQLYKHWDSRWTVLIKAVHRRNRKVNLLRLFFRFYHLHWEMDCRKSVLGQSWILSGGKLFHALMMIWIFCTVHVWYILDRLTPWVSWRVGNSIDWRRWSGRRTAD